MERERGHDTRVVDVHERGEREIHREQRDVATAQTRGMGVETLPRPLDSAALTIHESCFRHSS